ncbi:MAG: class I SAM-dependent methyltransferase [candidate division Zixibacteria bacterium]|nr:class I SAM-dependent methyltransferase [candidate division Zixibacteria bacterium]
METMQFNQTKAEKFADSMIDIINKGSLALMTSIGHRVGLFDTLAKLPPSTSIDIAEAADLNERYVREWLGAMVVGGFIDYDPAILKYSLPPEHAAFLTRDATPDNTAVFTQYIPLLGSIEDRIINCFKNGGGVAYEEYGRFHQVMAEDSGQTVVPALVDSILPLAPGLIDDLKRGINVLDIGCGSGRAINLMAGSFPRSRFWGYDISDDAIKNAGFQAKREGLNNARFEQVDMTTFDRDAEYDLITAFDAIHDQARPDLVLAGVAKALKPDGTFLMQDIAGSKHVQKNIEHPIGPFLYTISCLHCMSVSLAQKDGAGLGTMWGEETALEMLKEAGFSKTEVKRLSHDFQNNFYINRKN